jgi:dipeptidyl aminopeptidase/acylaminoacyl peptidase
MVTSAQKRFEYILIDNDEIYWSEMRPMEGGRYTIVKRTKEGKIEDTLPLPYSARTRVHEYGGLSFAVSEGTLYFVNEKDQRIYMKNKPMTEAGTRFADLRVAGDYLIAVGEKGKDNFLAAIEIKTGRCKQIASGEDFYASPELSPDGKKLAFLTWNCAHMPWDGTDLWVGDFQDGNLSQVKHVAGGKTESIFQPQWSPEGILHFISDKSGFWNLYKIEQERIEALSPKEAEFGLPQWVFGLSTYAFLGSQILAAYEETGSWQLATLNPFKKLDIPGNYFSQIRAKNGHIAFIQGSFSEGKSVVYIPPQKPLTPKNIKVLARNRIPHLDKSFFSIPQFISFRSSNGRSAYGFYYPPANQNFKPRLGELPPLIVKTHGGPTGCAPNTFDLKIQYWTSRGFALLDVDYGGSTGYGKAYRDSLKGNWGIVDVEDCEAGARFLIEKKLVDPKRLAITGGSAGGFTTLSALTFGKLFTVGASYYGVSDLSLLANETHKAESHYLDQLIAPYPEKKEIYDARSPIFSVDKLHCPIIFFQGLEDKIVPPNQAEKMYTALRKRGIPTELVMYEGEQHSFRKAENIRDSLEKELAFYLKAWAVKK